MGEILSKGNMLRNLLEHISLKDVPLSAIMVGDTSQPLMSLIPIVDTKILEEAKATTEIFRHAAIIYLYRLMMGDNAPLDAKTKESYDEAFRLLAQVPEYPSFLFNHVNVVSSGPDLFSDGL